MLEKTKNWIKNNKGFTIVILLALVLIIILTIIFISLLKGNSSNKYGNRLDGIDDVKISKEEYDGVKEEIINTDLVEDISIRLQGKIVYTTIILKSDTSVDKAKEIASNTLDNYTEDELKYYDFSYFLKWNKEEEITVITGNKHNNMDSITWVKS